MKVIKLTSHPAAMHLMVQFSGDRMVPRQRFGPGSQFFMGTSAEQRTKTLMAHRQVVQDLQQIEQNSNRN